MSRKLLPKRRGSNPTATATTASQLPVALPLQRDVFFRKTPLLPFTATEVSLLPANCPLYRWAVVAVTRRRNHHDHTGWTCPVDTIGQRTGRTRAGPMTKQLLLLDLRGRLRRREPDADRLLVTAADLPRPKSRRQQARDERRRAIADARAALGEMLKRLDTNREVQRNQQDRGLIDDPKRDLGTRPRTSIFHFA